MGSPIRSTRSSRTRKQQANRKENGGEEEDSKVDGNEANQIASGDDNADADANNNDKAEAVHDDADEETNNKLFKEPLAAVSGSSDDDDGESEKDKEDDDNDDENTLTDNQDDGSTKAMVAVSTDVQQPVNPSSSSLSQSSRLFAPYRTVGVVSSGGQFCLVPHQNSAQALVACPIGDRFQLLQTNRLHPVLVSQAVVLPSATATIAERNDGQTVSKRVQNRGQWNNTKSERCIQHVVTDSSLSITLVTHGGVTIEKSAFQSRRSTATAATPPTTRSVVDTVTLFARTQPIASQSIVPKYNNNNDDGEAQWTIQHVVSMGRIQTQMDDPEKHGKLENAAVMAVILAKLPNNQFHRPSYDTNLDSSDDDDDDDDSYDSGDRREDTRAKSNDEMDQGNDMDYDNDEENASLSRTTGQIVVLICTRKSLRVQKRIALPHLFMPVTAMHPSTYLNKLVVGGSLQTDGATAYLVNIRTGTIVHQFACLENATPTTKATTATTPLSKGTHPDVEAEAVTAMEQAPALDTAAVGTNRGMVHLINLKHDRRLFSLAHKRYGNAPESSSINSHHVTITSLSFRTDASALHYGVAPMAVGRSDGTITVWDLTAPEDPALGRTILNEMHRVHPQGVAKIQYFPQEPLLLSTGTSSNSILMHIFDKPDHSARLLRHRKGHTAPPSRARYLHAGAGAGGGVLVNASDGTDASSCQILSSGGQDRTLRVFSTARTVLDKEYSQGAGMEKRARKLGLDSISELLLPPTTGMAMSEARSREWGDLVTIHQDHSLAYVWSTRRGAQSGPVLRQLEWNVSAMKKAPPRQTHATAVAMSACGSFALIGTRGGTIYRYNVQSGISRGSYPRSATSSNEKGSKAMKTIGDINRTTKALEKTLKTSSRPANLDKKKIDAEASTKRDRSIKNKVRAASHNGFAVTGVAVDIANKTLISVGDDCKLILWNFQTHAPHKKSPCLLSNPATRLCHVRDSDLAAIALKDFSAVLFDCSALTIVRRFGAGQTLHTAAISDLCFSPDGRTLYTSSLDSTIRVWDVPTNKCVDWLGFQSPPTSLTMSPTGEYLATTHMGKLGICIWNDKSFYQTVHIEGTEMTEPARMDDPIPISDAMDEMKEYQLDVAKATAVDDGKYADIDDGSKVPAMAREPGLITLSGLPQSHWKNLFHLELVKQRNKPVEPPKKPPSAPFFLQWRAGESTLGPTIENNSGVQDTTNEAENDEEEWAAAWTDDGIDENEDETEKKVLAIEHSTLPAPAKRQKVTHFRSHLAHLLLQCSNNRVPRGELRFQAVTDHIATLGPSAIDVTLSTLCNGMHDLKEGLPLLILSSQWLLEACTSKERFEAVNAYLHRFLYLHTVAIAGIDESSIHGHEQDNDTLTPEELEEKSREQGNRAVLLESVKALKLAQRKSSEELRGKMEHTLCLLRHFSRMV